MEKWKESVRALFEAYTPTTCWRDTILSVTVSMIWIYRLSSKTGVAEITLDWNLGQYARALEPPYLGIIWKSILMASATTAICLVVAFPSAIAIAFAKPTMRMWLLLLVILPPVHPQPPVIKVFLPEILLALAPSLFALCQIPNILLLLLALCKIS